MKIKLNKTPYVKLFGNVSLYPIFEHRDQCWGVTRNM